MVIWLAILGLGSLVNPGAWGDYVTLPANWLLTYLVLRMRSDARALAALGLAWVFQFFVIGTMPFGEWFSLQTMAALSLVGAALLYGVYAWVLLHPSPTAETARLRPRPERSAGGPARHQSGRDRFISPQK